MTPIRINGHRIPCRICKRRYAKALYGENPLCTDCLKALVVGVHIGRMEYRHAQVDHIEEARR